MIDQVIVTSEPDCCGTRLVTVRRGDRAVRGVCPGPDDLQDAVAQCVAALDIGDGARAGCDEHHDHVTSLWCSRTVDGQRTRFLSVAHAKVENDRALLEKALVARVRGALGVDHVADFAIAESGEDVVLTFRFPGTITLAKLRALSVELGTDRINISTGDVSEDPTYGDSEEAGYVEVFMAKAVAA